MELAVTNREDDGISVVHLEGDIDVTSAPRLRDELSRVIADGHTTIVVDLTDVPFLDSTALGVLVGRLKAVRTAEGDLSLVIGSERLMRNFRITGLHKVFHLYPTVDEALAAAKA